MIINSTLTVPNCQNYNFCQACDETITTKCLYCYNSGDLLGLNEQVSSPQTGGQFGSSARAGSSATATECTNGIPTAYSVTNCLFYNFYGPTSVYTGMATTSIINKCLYCDSRDFILMSEYGPTEYCASKSIYMSGVDCIKISNCKQTVCYNGTTTNYVWCNICESGYIPSGIAQMDSTTQYRAASCITGKPISNCEYYEISGTSTSPVCFRCQNGYTTSYNKNSCVQTSGDTENCLRLNSSGEYCLICLPKYWFSAAKCRQKGFLIDLSIIGLIFTGITWISFLL